MPTENVIQAMLAFIIGLTILCFANELASIPLNVRGASSNPSQRKFRVLRGFWIFCAALWIVGSAFLLIDPSLAIQSHANSGVPR